jgi:hypothetical protein
MANLVSKNVQKSSEAGLITAASTLVVYVTCLYLHWDLNYLSASMLVVVSAVIGGIYNYLKHRRA